MRIYFVTVGKKDEKNVIKELQPQNILLSYFYFNKREKIERFINDIGYKPNILLDSGAFSALNLGKHIALTAYIKFIKDNTDLINEYIQLDVVENPKITKAYLQIMQDEGLAPIPVFTYGTEDSYLQELIDRGATRIALGGTVPISSKSKVAEWAKYFCWLYPNIKFHLLGSSSLKILNHCDIDSVDSSTWIMQAMNGQPPHLNSKAKRMAYNMTKLLEYEEGAN
jgi:queuine/archaeosine tRNA-ribosyltransferase